MLTLLTCSVIESKHWRFVFSTPPLPFLLHQPPKILPPLPLHQPLMIPPHLTPRIPTFRSILRFLLMIYPLSSQLCRLTQLYRFVHPLCSTPFWLSLSLNLALLILHRSHARKTDSLRSHSDQLMLRHSHWRHLGLNFYQVSLTHPPLSAYLLQLQVYLFIVSLELQFSFDPYLACLTCLRSQCRPAD